MDTIYVNSADRTARLTVPVTPSSSSADVNVYVKGQSTPVYTPATVTPETDGLSFMLPFSLVQDEKDLFVTWSFTYTENSVEQTYNGTTYIEVVTPILTDKEIKEIHPNATAYEITRIEKAVRHIIQAFTGQKFGKFVGTKDVQGTGSLALNLPARLVSITSVNNVQNVSDYFLIDGGGWVLRHYPWGVPPVKADYYGLHQHVGGVIHNPNSVKIGEFNASTTYSINGVWGWETVPSQVKEAARLLVNDYACTDINYRDRYLTSMTAADWRIQFNSGAFLKTGNVRADQLLNDYVLKRGWAVI